MSLKKWQIKDYEWTKLISLFFINRVKNTQGEFVLYAMTAQSFESLALNFEQIKRFIEAQNQVILYYEKSVIIEKDLEWN